MSAPRAKRIAANDWQNNKNQIENLWLKEKRRLVGKESVQEIMETKYGFYATQSQYEAQFKKWKWGKNQKSNDWQQLSVVLLGRERQGKETEVFINGELQSHEKVRKEVSRHAPSIRLHLSLTSTMPELPNGVAIRTPSSDQPLKLLTGLPFHVFESQIQATIDALDCQDPTWSGFAPIESITNLMEMDNHNGEDEDWYHDGNLSSVEEVGIMMQQPFIDTETWDAVLSSILPVSLSPENHTKTIVDMPSNGFFVSPLLKGILFSVANGYAGLSAFPTKTIVLPLQRKFTERHYQVIRTVQGHASRAMLQTLFKAAIEAGEAEVVDRLLRENQKSLNVNEQLCIVDGLKYTPIERAVFLRHEGVVKSLLKHKADVNKSYSHDHQWLHRPYHPQCSGALEYATRSCSERDRDRQHSSYLDADRRIIQMLLTAGAHILSDVSLIHLITCGEGENVILVADAIARKNIVDWNEREILRNAIRFLDDQTSMHLIQIILDSGGDLNNRIACGIEKEWQPKRSLRDSRPGSRFRDSWGSSFSDSGPGKAFRGLDEVKPSSVIDVATQLGKLRIVKLLLDVGAVITGDTLTYAIIHGDKEMVLMLLTHGADVNSIGWLQITPITAAIAFQRKSMISILEANGASITEHDQLHCKAVLKAASEAGDKSAIERLIQSGGIVDTDDLTWALVKAIENRQDEIAKILIDAGPPGLGYALEIAIKNDRDDSARLLIDNGAAKSVGAQFALSTAIGNDRDEYAVLLINAGVDVNLDVNPNYYKTNERNPLRLALRKRKKALTYALLDADALCNGGLLMKYAVEWGDRSVIKSLVFAGADINSARGYNALNVAVRKGDHSLVQFLLDFGADINEQRGGTALAAAIKSGDFSMTCFLLDHGANPDDTRALERAIRQESKFLDLLLPRHSARYPKGWGGAAFRSRVLVHAIEQGDVALTKVMLAKSGCTDDMVKLPAPPECASRRSSHFAYKKMRVKPFKYAIIRKQSDAVDLVEMFLIAGFNPDKIVSNDSGKTYNGVRPPRDTAFLTAIGTQRLPMIELFLRHEASINLPARSGVKRTPLQRAAELGNIDILELLLNHGGDVNAPAAQRAGGTALQLAAIGGYIPVVCRLINLKADVNAPKAKVDGRTALEGAAEHGRLDTVHILLRAGAAADPEESSRGQVGSAIKLAKENGHFPICDLIESHFGRGRQDIEREMMNADSGDYFNGRHG